MTQPTPPVDTRIFTARLFTETHGQCMFSFECPGTLASIAELWTEAWDRDTVLHFGYCADGYYRAIPAREILRFEIREGYDLPSVEGQ